MITLSIFYPRPSLWVGKTLLINPLSQEQLAPDIGKLIPHGSFRESLDFNKSGSKDEYLKSL